MKKIFMMLAVALPMFFMASCGDDNDESVLSLDKTAAELNYGTTVKLIPSEKKGEWASNNEFVATVDKDGNVKAEHVGKATITYVKDGESASCVVTVKPTNTYFDTYQDWGVSAYTVMHGVPSTWEDITPDDTTDFLMYAVNSDYDYPWYGFDFEDDKLAGSTIYFTKEISIAENYKAYITQRFKDVTEDEDDFLTYIDGETKSQANTAAVVEVKTVDGVDIYSITYMPIEHTKAAGINTNLVVRARAFLKEAKTK
ncbi:MAG: Ig-like domain-containing protein [Muribaculaceae bacterium]|nr:Ig-like domain-containing protein [Muribaculaceae bacterium]